MAVWINRISNKRIKKFCGFTINLTIFLFQITIVKTTPYLYPSHSNGLFINYYLPSTNAQHDSLYQFSNYNKQPYLTWDLPNQKNQAQVLQPFLMPQMTLPNINRHENLGINTYNYNKNSKIKNIKTSNNEDSEESSEWEFDNNSQRVSLKEWELKNVQKSNEKSYEKQSNRKKLIARRPCFSPGCRTWITIAIPNGNEKSIEDEIIDNESSNIGRIKSSVISQTVSLKNLKKKLRPNIQQPSISNKKKEKLLATTTYPITKTTNFPFVFSTSWILSLKRVTLPLNLRPITMTPPNSQQKPDLSDNFAIKSIEKDIISNSKINELKPFTLKPKENITSSGEIFTGENIFPEKKNKIVVSEETSNIKKKKKPWTHSSSGLSSTKKIKHRPTTTLSALEEAAIWASTELIEAIHEAIEKFREILNRAERAKLNVAYHANKQELVELNEAIKSKFNNLKNGNWIERTLAQMVMSDEGFLNKNIKANNVLSSLLPSFLLKLKDDYVEAMEKNTNINGNLKKRF